MGAVAGVSDQVVIWQKPKNGPSWLTVEEYEALPSMVSVRELRNRVELPGVPCRPASGVRSLARGVRSCEPKDGSPSPSSGRPRAAVSPGGYGGVPAEVAAEAHFLGVAVGDRMPL